MGPDNLDGTYRLRDCARKMATAVGREARCASEPEGHIDGSLAELDEPALVEACLAGRLGAFDVIVERHQRSVLSVCVIASSATTRTRPISHRTSSFVPTAGWARFAANRRWRPGCIESA